MTSNLLTTIQSIAVNAVQSTNPMQYCYGTVTNADPLKIRLNDTTLEITGNSILLTESVVEKKITIKKHTHDESEELADVASAAAKTGGPVSFVSAGIPPVTSEGIKLKHKHTIETRTLEAVCTEFGKDLPVDRNDERIVITTNRALEKDDRVLMLRVSAGQRFIVLSRVFTRSDETD